MVMRLQALEELVFEKREDNIHNTTTIPLQNPPIMLQRKFRLERSAPVSNLLKADQLFFTRSARLVPDDDPRHGSLTDDVASFTLI